MNKLLKNVIAVILGVVVGSVVNMGLIKVGHALFPIEGVYPNDMEALKAAMPNMDPIHLLFPFLAHALGTLVGAFVAFKVAASHQFKFAMAIGLVFFLGGISAAFMLPAPIWFIVLDLGLAYFPMAWLATRGSKA